MGNEVPTGWQAPQAASLFSLEYGKALPARSRSGSGHPVMGSNGVVGHHETPGVSGPGIVVGRKGTAGSVQWSEIDFHPIDTTYFVKRRGELELRWLYYALLDLKLPDLCETTGIPGLNRNNVYERSILLPPLPEQKKIAEILSSVDEAIRATEAVIEQTRRVKEGLLQSLLTRGIGHTRFKQTEIGEIPVGWEVVKLGTVAEVRSGIAKNANRALSDPVDVSYLRVANVQDGFLDLSEVKKISIERSALDRYSLCMGDVLMNEGGDIDKLGRGDIWAGQLNPCVHQNHVFSVRCGPRVRPRLVSYLAESRLGKAYFLAKGKQTTNLASINKSQLRAFPVPLPGLTEQDRIIERLNAIRKMSDNAAENRRQLKQLKSGLLQDLLSGKVRVKP